MPFSGVLAHPARVETPASSAAEARRTAARGARIFMVLDSPWLRRTPYRPVRTDRALNGLPHPVCPRRPGRESDGAPPRAAEARSEEHTSELQSRRDLV